MNITNRRPLTEPSLDNQERHSQRELIDFVVKVRHIAENDLGVKKSYFHISPCHACLAPVWQQPCPVYGYYPPFRPLRSEIPLTSFDKFQKLVNRNGGYAVWYFAHYRNSVAYSKNSRFKSKLEKIITWLSHNSSFKSPDPNVIWEITTHNWCVTDNRVSKMAF